jgi:hypothetical protein
MALRVWPSTCILPCVVVLAGHALIATLLAGEGPTLVRDGRSDYCIVMPAAATVTEKKAAEELQHFIERISGATLPIFRDDQPVQAREIVVGASSRLHGTKISIDWPKLGSDGYVIKTADDKLIIAGSNKRGTLYGVYGFLEDHLGCRWYSSVVSRIPTQKTITLGAIDEVQVPAFAFREVYYADAMDPDFAARLKLNGNASTMKEHVLAVERHAGWATWCHTAFSFVPPKVFFRDHPDYYALTGGKRQATQLCYANPDVLGVTLAKVKDLFQHPVNFEAGIEGFIPRTNGPYWADKDDHYIDISQMDRSDNCTCPDCRAIDDREETPMGSLLTFINRVAENFPDKTISTLSYQYTRRPPKNIRPRDNVSIMLCNIECGRALPIAKSPHDCDRRFVQDVVEWSKICRNLSIWDYCVNFVHLMAPNPNLRVQQPNIKFFRDHQVRGYFAQGSREIGGDLCELRNYLIAKLCWNPDANAEAIINDFVDGFYGPAAGPIRRYLALISDAAEKMPQRMGLGDSPQEHADTFLRPELLRQYDALFDEAERLAAGDAELLDRIRATRMSLMYAKLELADGSPAEQLETLRQFADLCRKNHIRRLSEWGNPPDAYVKQAEERIRKAAP